MAEDPLDDIIASVRSSLRVELERQLNALSERHHQALGAARRQIEADAEQQWTARLEAVTRELESARAERDQQIQAVRDETDRHTAEEVARARDEMEQVIAAERQRSQSRLDAERAEWTAAHATGAQTAPSHTHPDALLRAMRDI